MKIKREGLSLLLSFLLGVLSTIAIFYLVVYEQIAPRSTTASEPLEERKPVYLNGNEIIAQKTSKNLMIDGIERTLTEDTPLLRYNDELYAPLGLISEYLGKSHTEAANGVVIGNYTALEPLAFTDAWIPFSYIGSTFNREQMELQLGDPLSESELVAAELGGTETMVEYSGALVYYSSPEREANVLRIIVREPIMSTYRGITVGSTKEDILKKYGEPEPNSTDELWLYGETYTLWFRFAEDEVTEFGNLYIDLSDEGSEDEELESDKDENDSEAESESDLEKDAGEDSGKEAVNEIDENKQP